MKKGEIYEGEVVDFKFPNKGIVAVDTEEGSKRVIVKNVLVGQRVSFRLTKKRSEQSEGLLIAVIRKADYEIDSDCPHFDMCGGCMYRNVPYDKQLEMKENLVRTLCAPYLSGCKFEPIKASPQYEAYRNKMEFSFGDMSKDGELELGLHKRGSFYDIISVRDCRITDKDYGMILSETLSYFRGKETPYFHKRTHEGYLRHLLVRKAAKTGEILIDLVTTSATPKDTMCTMVGLLEDWTESLLALKLSGKIVGILHTVNDNVADAIINEHTDVLYGRDYFYEELLELTFKITPFSFFQTNSLSAEVLYDTVREFVLDSIPEGKNGKELEGKTVFDLYSGTGTIAQLMSKVSGKVIGVEIVAEAVDAARENAAMNKLENCEFIAGDVLKVLDDIKDRPDFIILDPPRDGVNPKALKKIMDYGVNNIVYISCKPTSLARDLEMLTLGGYQPVRMCTVDQFPATGHVETVVLLGWKDVDDYMYVDYAPDHHVIQGGKATYREITEWIKDKYGVHVTNLNIAQVKDKCGFEKRENYNKGAQGHKIPNCTLEKEKMIMEAFKHFNMI